MVYPPFFKSSRVLGSRQVCRGFHVLTRGDTRLRTVVRSTSVGSFQCLTVSGDHFREEVDQISARVLAYAKRERVVQDEVKKANRRPTPLFYHERVDSRCSTTNAWNPKTATFLCDALPPLPALNSTCMIWMFETCSELVVALRRGGSPGPNRSDPEVQRFAAARVYLLSSQIPITKHCKLFA